MLIDKNKDELLQIIENIGWMIFDRIFMLILNLLVTVKIANHFGSLEYGIYQYATNLVAIFELLVTFVDGRVVKKQYKNQNIDIVVSTASISRFIFAIFSTILGIVFIFVYHRSQTFTTVFVILLFNMIIANLKFGMVNRFEYLLKSKKVVIASDCAAIIGTLLQLIAVYMGKSIITISMIAFISSAINLLIVTIQYKLEFKNTRIKSFDYTILKIIIKESIPLAIAASCSILYTRCDSIMLGAMLSANEVGIYSISVKLISIIQIVIVPIRESVYPKLINLYNTDKVKYEKTYIGISSFLTWVYIIGVFASFIVLPYIFKVLNEEYYSALKVYKIHIWGTFFVYNAALRAGHFTMINRGEILMYAQIFSVIVNILLNIVGIKLWGMYGAAIATVITQGLSLMLSNLVFGKDGRKIFMWQVKAINPFRMIR